MEEKILLEISLMLIFSIVGYLISIKLRQPINVGIILIAMVIGPGVLGWVHHSDMLNLLARIGAIILLFVSGLSSNMDDIFNKRSIWIASAGAIFPFIGGFAASHFFGYDFSTALFVGAMLTATCLGITSALLRELGKINTETAKAMLGAAVVDDVIGLLTLSIVMKAPNISVSGIFLTILLVLLFFGFVYFLGDFVLRRLVDFMEEKTRQINPKLAFVLGVGLVFGLSYIAEFIGLAAIVGAFLAGIALSKSKVLNSFYAGGEYLEIVFASIFFFSIGIMVEIGALKSVFWFTLAITLVAFSTKIIGCGLAAYKNGFKKKDALIIGVGMAPRGEVAFIIAMQGLFLGIINKEVYSAVVFMSFFTTVGTLVLLKGLYGREKSGKKAKQSEFIEIKVGR